MNTIKTAPFALDPTLPWLFSDRKMQEADAFHGMKTVTLNERTYEPMGQYFPGGTQVAVRLVTSLDQLKEGAAYWHEVAHYDTDTKKTSRHYSFGRYARLAYPESKSTPRRWKKGEAHIILECDVLDCDLFANCLRDDGTDTVFVNTGQGIFGQTTHTLYEITHYVKLPDAILGELGPEAIKQTGLTLRQATWLKQELELTRNSVELTMQMDGGLNLPDYRVVLPWDEVRNFLSAQESCPQITASQARKCKSGTITITMRHHMTSKQGYRCTEHYKLIDGAILIDWMRHHSDLQDAKLNAAVSRQIIGHIADKFNAQRIAQEAAAMQAQAVAASGLTLPQQSEYEDVKELAHAA